jgi:hypothetical protein
MKKIRYDVWSGEKHCDHVARKHYELEPVDCDDMANEMLADLQLGYLVNCRLLEEGEESGPELDFDQRPRRH